MHKTQHNEVLIIMNSEKWLTVDCDVDHFRFYHFLCPRNEVGDLTVEKRVFVLLYYCEVELTLYREQAAGIDSQSVVHID